MATDKEILDEIENIVDRFTKVVYADDGTDEGRAKFIREVEQVFYMGQIWGTLMKREKE